MCTHPILRNWFCPFSDDVCIHAYGVESDSFAAPRTVAHQASLSMGFSRQECWSRLSFPSPGNLSDPGIKPSSPASPALAGGFFTTASPLDTIILMHHLRSLPSFMGKGVLRAGSGRESVSNCFWQPECCEKVTASFPRQTAPSACPCGGLR